MVLLNSEEIVKMDKKEYILSPCSLAFIIVYTSITVFLSSIYNYNINQNPWEKDSDFQGSV